MFIKNGKQNHIVLVATLEFQVHISRTIMKSANQIAASFHNVLIILAISLH